MPEFHSPGGNWHSGKKENCRKCNPPLPAPVVKVEPVEVKKPANGRRKKKETVNADV